MGCLWGLARDYRLLNQIGYSSFKARKLLNRVPGVIYCGFRTSFYFQASLFVVFWAGILAVSIVAIPSIETTVMEG